jgi:inhibitor of cysteine peptidase
LNNAEVQGKLNSLFARLAAEAKNRGYENEKDLVQAQIENHIKAEVYFNYEVKYNQKGMLSIVFMDYQYSGGAHGITVQSSYTFDLETGTEYEIKDLFKDGSDYVSMISNEVK